MKLSEQDKNLLERLFNIDTDVYVPTFTSVFKDEDVDCISPLSYVIGEDKNTICEKHSIYNDAILLIVHNVDTDNKYTCICIKGKNLDLDEDTIIENIGKIPTYAVYTTYKTEDSYKIMLTNTIGEECEKIENRINELDGLCINGKLNRKVTEMENCFIIVYSKLNGDHEALFIYFKDIDEGEENE